MTAPGVVVVGVAALSTVVGSKPKQTVCVTAPDVSNSIVLLPVREITRIFTVADDVQPAVFSIMTVTASPSIKLYVAELVLNTLPDTPVFCKLLLT